MALQPLERDVIEGILGVKPRRKGLHIATKDEKTDKKITGALDDYTRREEKVLDAVKELEAVPATAHIVVALERKVAAVRRTVETTIRDDAPDDIRQAYKDLEDIKEEARAAAKLANANKGFYEKLEVADRAFHVLVDDAHHAIVEDDTPAIEQGLQRARDAAKTGDFTTARKELDAAQNACGKATLALDSFNKDLALFGTEAQSTEGGLTYLDAHPAKYAGAGDIGTATQLLADARAEANTNLDLTAARKKLAEAEQARIKAKTAADNAVIKLIDDAKVALDAVLNGADPAVAKAMADEIGLIDATLITARSQVATEILKADKSLDDAVKATLLAGTHRDDADRDIKKLRADAKLTEAALKSFAAHPQKAHAEAERQNAAARVTSAGVETELGHIVEARRLQTEADDFAGKAKDFADKYAAFLVKYADAVRLCNGAKKAFDDWPQLIAAADTALIKAGTARTKADTQRKYAEAATDLTNAVAILKNSSAQMKTAALQGYTADIANLENSLLSIVPPEQPKSGTADFSAFDALDADPNAALVAEMQKLREMKAKIEAYADAGNWYEVSSQMVPFARLVASTKKVAARRERYNTDRQQTVAAIKSLDTYKSLRGHMMSLNALVVRADKLATTKDMRFEDACKQLADIRETCTALKDIGKAADTYIRERAEADTLLEELEKAA